MERALVIVLGERERACRWAEQVAGSKTMHQGVRR
jgi:hypothetical protein